MLHQHDMNINIIATCMYAYNQYAYNKHGVANQQNITLAKTRDLAKCWPPDKSRKAGINTWQISMKNERPYGMPCFTNPPFVSFNTYVL